MSKQIGAVLFRPAKHIPWNGVVSTDGVTANWHCFRPSKIKKKSSNKTNEVRVVDQLSPTHYGNFPANVVFNRKPKQLIVVDPGHVNLMAVVRVLDSPSKPGAQTLKTGNQKQKRRQNLQRHLEARQRSLFNLSNKEWSANCGRLTNRRRNLDLANKLELQESIDLLSLASSRTGFFAKYWLHVRTRIQTAPVMQKRMATKICRRWKFEAYQKEQRAVKKLSTDLLNGMSPSDTLVVWGNGGFGPTSHGHAPAPNSKLQLALAHYLPVVVASEFRSSQTSTCHHCCVKSVKRPGQKKRATVLKCLNCSTLHSRDFNAAHVIADMFLAMQTTSDLPDWIKVDAVRQSNLLIPLAV